MERKGGATCVALLALAPALGAAAGEHQIYAHAGTEAHGEAGAAVAALGDVDDDGLADYAFGVPGAALDAPGRVEVRSGATGTLLFAIPGDGIVSFRLGRDLVGAGDLDGDGKGDLVVVAEGLVRAYAGAGGALLWQVVCIEGELGFARVAAVGDVTGDGRGDVLVGVSQARFDVDLDVVTVDATGPGYAWLVSGADGELVASFTGEAWGDAFGGTVAAAGDADADGTPDLAVGCFDEGMTAAGGGYLTVYSGATLAPLWTLGGSDEWLPGLVAAPLGDVDGDGRDDLVVGLPALDRARVVSGADGATLVSILGAPGDGLGRAVARIDDVDGDGLPEALVGAPQTPETPLGRVAPLASPVAVAAGGGYVRIASGATGATLVEIPGLAPGAGFGQALMGLGDVNGDGVPDLAVGAPLAAGPPDPEGTPGAPAAGRVQVFSAQPLALTTAAHEVSCAASPVIVLEIHAGRANAGGQAWLLGSLAGGAPGFELGALHVPLVPDVYTSLLAAATPLAAESPADAVALDEDGHGWKKLVLPAALADYCRVHGPLTAWHAFVGSGPEGGAPTFATNAVPVTLEP